MPVCYQFSNKKEGQAPDANPVHLADVDDYICELLHETPNQEGYTTVFFDAVTIGLACTTAGPWDTAKYLQKLEELREQNYPPSFIEAIRAVFIKYNFSSWWAPKEYVKGY